MGPVAMAQTPFLRRWRMLVHRRTLSRQCLVEGELRTGILEMLAIDAVVPAPASVAHEPAPALFDGDVLVVAVVVVAVVEVVSVPRAEQE